MKKRFLLFLLIFITLTSVAKDGVVNSSERFFIKPNLYSNIAVTCVNNTGTDVTILMRNNSTLEVYFFTSYATGEFVTLGSVPEGNYDVEIIEYYNGASYRPTYTWCGTYSETSDSTTFSAYFYGLNISGSCSSLYIH